MSIICVYCLPLETLRCQDDHDNEKRQKSNSLNKQNDNFARASRFFVHFSAATARLRQENA